MIDWTKPLELMDGTPVRLSEHGYAGGPQPDSEGEYRIERVDGGPMNDGFEFDFADVNGQSFWDGVRQDLIRNREPTPEAHTEPTETLRDRFAMAALMGLLAADASPLAFSLASRHAWLMADKMMAQRNG